MHRTRWTEDAGYWELRGAESDIIQIKSVVNDRLEAYLRWQAAQVKRFPFVPLRTVGLRKAPSTGT